MCLRCQSYSQEVLRLRAQVEIANEMNRQLREVIAEPVAFPRSWGLTPGEARVLATLAKSRGEYATKTALHVAVSGFGSETSPQIVNVYIVGLRRKVARLGVEIECVWALGYRLTPESRGILAPYVTKPAAVAA